LVARSVSDQCEIGTPASAGSWVARTTTLCRSSGGKSGRAATTRAVVQAVQAVLGEAPTPLADPVGIAAEFGRHVPVLRGAGFGTQQDQAGTEGQALWAGAGVSEGVQVLCFLGRKQEDGGAAGHGARSLCC